MARIGVLHSLSGTMSMSERPLVDAIQLAVEQVNSAGGLLGEEVETVVADGASDPEVFAAQARRLIGEEGAHTLFGCWTSASRKAVKPIIQEAGALLWYPVQYEGLEQSPNIFYFGSTLNQQIEPAVKWCLEHLGKRFFLVGSDYVFPRTANRLVRALVALHGGEIVGEQYVVLGGEDFSSAVAAIEAARPDLVFNTVNGHSNIAFYRQLAEMGRRVPVMAVSIAEEELAAIGPSAVGHYACWGYFQSLDLPANREFVAAFRARFGAQRVTSDPIASAYCQVRLWAEAVKAARSFAPDEVSRAAIGLRMAGPMGEIRIFPNHHVAKPALIGQANGDGQFDILHRSAEVIEPLPWLGMESVNLPASALIREALSELPKEISYSTRLQQEIARRKAVEEELQLLNETLEQQVKEAVEKNLDQERLLIHQSRLAETGEMIHYIAHQWKQPLNALSLVVNDVKDAFEHGDLDGAYLDGSVVHANRLIKRMADTIDDFRNFYSADKERKAFAPAQVLKEVRSIIDGSLKGHEIRLEETVEGKAELFGVPNEYGQVVLNLINNAKEALVERKVRDGWIRVGIGREGDMVWFRVSDSGGGIRADILPRIFEPHFTTKEKGSGIGLYLAKIIIEKNMGGRIEVRNTPEGAEFSVICPSHS